LAQALRFRTWQEDWNESVGRISDRKTKCRANLLMMPRPGAFGSKEYDATATLDECLAEGIYPGLPRNEIPLIEPSGDGASLELQRNGLDARLVSARVREEDFRSWHDTPQSPQETLKKVKAYLLWQVEISPAQVPGRPVPSQVTGARAKGSVGWPMTRCADGVSVSRVDWRKRVARRLRLLWLPSAAYNPLEIPGCP